MKPSSFASLAVGLIALSLPACERMLAKESHHEHEEHQAIVVTSPKVMTVEVTQHYVCQIRSQRHIEIRALEEGYLEAIPIKEGQTVTERQVMFQILPTIYKARLDADQAEANLAQIEYEQTQNLATGDRPVVSKTEVALYKAKLERAKAKAAQAAAELDFATVRAPFTGIIDRLYQQQGSLVGKGDLLTTLSDNSTMWVYFNVPEVRYLEFKSRAKRITESDSQHLTIADSRIELHLANGHTFDQPISNTVTIEGKFNNETGNIQFRADVPNLDGLLRHGQTGNILIHRKFQNAIVIPQRATFEILDKRYVYIVGEDHVVHPHEIVVEHELDDIFVVGKGLNVTDRIVFEGVQQLRDGKKIEFEFCTPDAALANLKHHAE